ncbi:MAG: hypothetical protein COB40_06135 [Marinosulfonomonas sp.]|nr:MAG: hypothetical protein COB40_06135 [Marinosulfonomonas sp.]
MNFTTDTCLSDFNFQFASRKAMSHYYPWTRLLGFAAFGLFILAYGGAVYLNRASDSGDYNYLAHGGFLALFAYLVHLMSRGRKIVSALQNGTLRNGTTTLTLNDAGYHSEKSGYSVYIGWEHFDDAIETREGMILLIGLSRFMMIPNSAFSKDTIPSEILEQVKAWIASAKSANV